MLTAMTIFTDSKVCIRDSLHFALFTQHNLQSMSSGRSSAEVNHGCMIGKFVLSVCD